MSATSVKAVRAAFIIFSIAFARDAAANCQGGGNTQTVNPSPIPSLNQILESSFSPCTITVNAGTYNGVPTSGVPFDSIFRVRTGITVKASGAVTLSVPAGSAFGLIVQSLNLQVPNNATVDGFTITGGLGGVWVKDVANLNGGVLTNITLRNLVIDTDFNNAAGSHGIYFQGVQSSVIDSCTIVHARFNGIYLESGSNNNIVMNNTVQNTVVAHAIAVQGSSDNVIVANTVTGSAFDGIILNAATPSGTGSSRNRIERNTISGHKTDGITLSDASRFNYVGQNFMLSPSYDPVSKPVPSPTTGVGIWLNNGSNGNYVYGNEASGSPETGLDIFQSSGNYIHANRLHANLQGGMLVSNDSTFSAPGSVNPSNTFVHHNYVYFNTSNAMLMFRGSSASDVAYNFLSGRPGFGGALQSTTTGGIALGGTTAGFAASSNQVYENTISSVDTRYFVYGNVTSSSLFRNRHLDGNGNPAAAPGLRGLSYSYSPAGVQWDAGISLGGNHWSEFAAAGNPSRGTPYKRFIYDNIHGIDLNGPYVDKFPFGAEQLDRAYSVSVQEPFGGQIIAAGSKKTIRWLASGCVLVDLYYKSGSVTLIEADYPNVGFYAWSVPAGLSPGSYNIQVDCKDSTGGFPGATNDSAAFNVGTNALILLTPGRDFRATDGQVVRVAWKATGVSGTVSVFARVAGQPETTLVSGVSGNVVDVTLPPSLSDSNQVILRIQASGNANQRDAVDGYFMVRGAALSFTSPAGGTLQMGSIQFVRWVGPSSSYFVDLDLMEGAISVQAIARNLPDFGHYTWLVPEMWSNSSYLRATFHDATGTFVGAVNGAPFQVFYTTTPGSLVARYRLYSPVTLEHLYTTDLNEYNVLGTQVGTWNQEGVSSHIFNGPANVSGVEAIPYYRLYDRGHRWHLWTIDRNEYFTLRQLTGTWDAEGVDGYLLPSQAGSSVPWYRLLYADGRGLHLWTSDVNEKNTLQASGFWILEGPTTYVMP